MNTSVKIALKDIQNLSLGILKNVGYGDAHAQAIADMLYTCQLDDCQSHGLFRLFMCRQTMQAGKIDGQVLAGSGLIAKRRFCTRMHAAACPFWRLIKRCQD